MFKGLPNLASPVFDVSSVHSTLADARVLRTAKGHSHAEVWQEREQQQRPQATARSVK